MNFLTTSLIKQQLRIDHNLTIEDESLMFYGSIAEGAVQSEINRTIHADQAALDAALASDAEHNGIVINDQLKAAMLMVTADLYENRSTKQTEILYRNMAYNMLIDTYRSFA